MAQHVTVFPLEARSASATSRDFKNSSDGAGQANVGGIIYVSATSVTAGGMIVNFEGKDPVSNQYYSIISSAPIIASGTLIMRVHPDLTASTGLIAKDMVPPVWRVRTTVASGSLTFGVGVSLI